MSSQSASRVEERQQEAVLKAVEFLYLYGSFRPLREAWTAVLNNDTEFPWRVTRRVRYYYQFINLFCLMCEKYPYHRKFFAGIGFWTWVVLIEDYFIKAVCMGYERYKKWFARETDDEPKEVDNLQYQLLRLNHPTASVLHLVSFAPPARSTRTFTTVKSAYTITTVGVTYPSNQAYRHIISHFGAIHQPRPKTETWIHHYATCDLLTGIMDPVQRVLSGEDPTALTTATNPGAIKPHEMTNWFSQGGAVLDPEMGWMRSVLPQPAESVDVQPDWSNVEDNDEEHYHSLLEFKADPAASLMRRIKEKLGFLSKKERNDIFKKYVKRQEEEIELDQLREMEGINATDAAVMWETDEQAEDEADAAVPDIDYGYVPARPILSEPELWSEYWEYYYSMTISERNKFVEALSWYSYNLSLHVKWYAIRQEEAEMVKNGEATLDPNAPIFPPNPAGNLALRDTRPHVLQAFSILPWGNHFMSTMHLATIVISTTKEIVKIMAAEAREQAEMAMAAPTLPPNAAQILADLDEAYKLIDSVGSSLVAAENLAATWLSRAIKARIFYPDTDELTDYEEVSIPDEYVPVADRPKKKKGKGKGKKKKGKKEKETEKENEEAVEQPASEAEEEKEKEEPKKKKKGKKSKKAKAKTAEAEAEPEAKVAEAEDKAEAEPTLPSTSTTAANLPPPPATAEQAGTTTTAPAAGLASLADRAAKQLAEMAEKTEDDWAAHFERQDAFEDEKYVHPSGAVGVPHDKRYVTGREGATRRV